MFYTFILLTNTNTSRYPSDPVRPTHPPLLPPLQGPVTPPLQGCRRPPMQGPFQNPDEIRF